MHCAGEACWALRSMLKGCPQKHHSGFPISLRTAQSRNECMATAIGTLRARCCGAVRGLWTLRQVKRTRAKCVIHVTGLDLPLPYHLKGVRHYLWIDSTWKTWHADRENLPTHLDSYPVRLRRSIESAEQSAFRQVKHIFTTANYLRESLISDYGVDSVKVTAVGTGRGGLDSFEGDKDYANGKILFVAKTRFEDKGRSLVLEAFRRAQQWRPSLMLQVVGDPELAASPPNTPNLQVLGYVTRDQLQDLFNRASLFVLPAKRRTLGIGLSRGARLQDANCGI